MSVPTSVLLIALLIGMGSLAKPVAERLRIPVSIVHALLGIGIGILCILAIRHPGFPIPAELARIVTDMPVGSDLFVYGLLPTLLFQSALAVDMHRIYQDLLPILLLALLAVVLVTFGIALALWPVAQMPLAACLLLAAIVATTDPVAVIAIFRGVGAPDHLVRLVEGESLFNDAAAVALFVAFLAMVVAPGEASAVSVLHDFLVLPAGGALVGVAAAWLAVAAMHLLPNDRVGTASLSLILPYLAYLAADAAGVSGVIAVVAAGVTLATLAPGRIAGETWRYLLDVWELLADSAAVLVFILTSILVPRLLAEAEWHHLWLIVVVFLAALAARSVVLLGLFPLLARFGRSLDVPASYRIVALWGGLRGSMTLVLALVVTENDAIPHEVAVFVATLATGFTLATLFIHGATLRPLMRRLGLDRLSEVDLKVRDLALEASARRAGGVPDRSGSFPTLDERTALTIALVAATAREREIVLDHFDKGTVQPRVARWLVAAARQRLDLTRTRGEEGYAEADADEVRFAPLDRLAVTAQRRLGWSAPLADRLEVRYQLLLETALVVRTLRGFVLAELAPVLGTGVSAQVTRLLERRLEALEREIEALRLQYPAYAASVEAAMALRATTATETAATLHMRRVGIASAEVERALLADIRRRAASVRTLPRLDLGLDPRRLVDAHALFQELTEAEKDAVARRLAPVFAVPGMQLIRKGDRGDAAYFISSGAVEVDTGRVQHRLGRGDAFGEMALIYDIERQADVTAMSYSNLLRLDADDFREFLDHHPALRERLASLAGRRREENVGVGGASAG